MTNRKLCLPQSIPPVAPLPATILNPQSKCSWITVTPALAMKWLDESNTNNRTVREDHVVRMAGDMTAGKWRGQNGEAIRFDKNGRLVDGQHRLWACIKAEKVFDTLLITDLDPEDYNTIGIGAKKSMSDFLGPVHGEKNVFLYSASLRLIHLWGKGLLGTSGKNTQPTISELEATYRDHPALRDSVNRVAGMTETRRILTASFMSLIHYAGTLEGRSAVVNSFLERLGNGLGMMADDPVYQLRKFLLAQRAPSPGARRAGQIYVLALAIKAWNASKQEQKVKQLRFLIDEEFPQL